MRAIVLERVGGPEELRVRELPDPQPGQDEVLVRVHAAGVCGRDLIDRRGGFRLMKLPTILGHEFAGEVVAVGAGVSRWAPGDRVANLHRPFCGECRSCTSGGVVDCERAWQSFGHTVDGGYAELCVSHQRALVEVPAELDYVQAASVGCTAGVALRALREEARLVIGESVLVTGASGGVGLMAIQIAKRAGARVFAVTGSERKVAAIHEAGADHVVVAEGEFDSKLRDLTDGGVDVALELVGRATFTSSMKSLRRRGRLVLMGNVTLDRITFNPGAVILFGTRILGSRGYSPRDLEDCFQMMVRGELRMMIDRILRLDQAAEAHQLLTDRATCGRIVLVPGS
jgi:NADPH:quinone reductase-like Zn-dependent oxidoreductase